MRRRQKESRYRPGGFLLHPIVLAVVLAGVAVWLGVFFGFGSTHGMVGTVAAVALIILGLYLGFFVFMAMTAEAVGMTIWLIDRTGQTKRRLPHRGRGSAELGYLYLLSAPTLVVALLLGFGFGYLAGGAFWGLYAGVLTLGAVALSEYLVARR